VQHFYFDHNATTPVAPAVCDVMVSCLGQVYGNASSIHHFGQVARQRLENARRQVAALLGCAAKEIVFTSGGTEADNLALLGTVRRKKHVITTAIEHPAVLNTCAQLELEGVAVTYVPVGPAGVVDPADVRRALRFETALISVMHANNELGTLQPVAEIAAIAREAGAVMHVDGVQAAGRIPVHLATLGADLYSVSGHKFYAPKGIGALYVRSKTPLERIIYGGHHERDRRPGTENVPGAVALGAAAELALGEGIADAARIGALRDRLEEGVLACVPRAAINGDRSSRMPHTTNIRFDGITGEALTIALDLRGFAVSTGSACSSGSVEPSHVLTAIGLTPEQARSSIRFSLGRDNTAGQVDALVEATADSVRHLRRISGQA
jgi:cysteine desulfurase